MKKTCRNVGPKLLWEERRAELCSWETQSRRVSEAYPAGWFKVCTIAPPFRALFANLNDWELAISWRRITNLVGFEIRIVIQGGPKFRRSKNNWQEASMSLHNWIGRCAPTTENSSRLGDISRRRGRDDVAVARCSQKIQISIQSFLIFNRLTGTYVHRRLEKLKFRLSIYHYYLLFTLTAINSFVVYLKWFKFSSRLHQCHLFFIFIKSFP